MNINTNGLITVKVTVGGWSGNVTDAVEGKRVADNAGADEELVKLVKRLMPRDMQEGINSANRAVTTVWKRNSLPFQDGGWRVLKAEKWPAMRDKLEAAVVVRQGVIDTLLTRWDEVVERGKALGSLFKPKEFPTREQARAKYYISIKPRPVPTGHDALNMRGLPTEESKRIADEMQAETKAELKKAVGSMVESIKDMVRQYKAALEDKGQKHTQYGKMAKTAQRVVESMKDLNLFGDEALNDLFRKTTDLFETAELNRAVLRKSARARSVATNEADVLDKALDAFGSNL